MKTVLVRAMLSVWMTLICFDAGATFVPITVAPNGGNAPTSSIIRAVATGRYGNTNETVISPIPAPYAGTISSEYVNPNDSPFSYVDAHYELASGRVAVDISRLDRSGPSSGTVNGAWLFSTTETVNTAVSGFLNIYNSESTTYNSLQAVLDDLTAQTRLFYYELSGQSIGGNFTVDTFGLNGSAVSPYSLQNVLVPDHAYRLQYLVGVGAGGAASGQSSAQARIALSVVPEPLTGPLLLIGLIAILAVRGRRWAVWKGGSGQQWPTRRIEQFTETM